MPVPQQSLLSCVASGTVPWKESLHVQCTHSRCKLPACPICKDKGPTVYTAGARKGRSQIGIGLRSSMGLMGFRALSSRTAYGRHQCSYTFVCRLDWLAHTKLLSGDSEFPCCLSTGKLSEGEQGMPGIGRDSVPPPWMVVKVSTPASAP